MALVDSHAHLHFSHFDEDRREVVERAREAGVTLIVDVGTTLASSRAAVALAEAYAPVYATVGVHPHDARDLSPEVVDELRALAHHPQVVAIGEIGLDYYRDLSPRPVQRRAFERQLALATELDLPVVVHSRDAHEDVLAVLERWGGRGVLHSYAAGPQRLDRVLALDFMVSISGPVTFSNAHALREVAARVPLDRLLVETDCPYLTPEPHRGRRNEPAYVRYVAAAVAEAQGVDVARLGEAVAQNASRMFGIS
jgi:TatD DNase family protein